MLFYKIEMESDRALESSEQKMRKTRARIKEETVEANERFRGEMNFFVSEIQDRKVSIGAAVFVEASTAERFDLMRGLAHFCRKIELRGRITEFE